MAYLEELLPEFRKGAKIRLPLWEKGQYLRYDEKNKNIVNDKGNDVDIAGCHLSSDRWEFYQEPIDYDYIIKNKCLCWFWNYDCIEGYRTVGILSSYDKGCTGKFQIGWSFYKHCRPVRRDEVTFYEDRRDER